MEVFVSLINPFFNAGMSLNSLMSLGYSKVLKWQGMCIDKSLYMNGHVQIIDLNKQEASYSHSS